MRKYTLYIFLILSIILIISLYYVEIPSPSIEIIEEYSLSKQ